jgi:hypothetical protein
VDDVPLRFVCGHRRSDWGSSLGSSRTRIEQFLGSDLEDEMTGLTEEAKEDPVAQAKELIAKGRMLVDIAA